MLSAIWVALQMLLKKPLPAKAIILTDSYCALESIMNEDTSMALAPVVEQSCRAVADAGWTSHLPWISSHITISGNEFIYFLAASAHDNDNPSDCAGTLRWGPSAAPPHFVPAAS